MDRIRLAIVSRTATYWPIFRALHDGAFADAGLDVVISEVGSTSAAVQALVDRRVDVAGMCPDLLVQAVDEGADLAIVGGLVDRPPAGVVVRHGLATVASLAGARIAMTARRGSVSRFLRAALRAEGLAPERYEQVVVGTTPEQADALRDGRVDAAMLTFPFDATVVREGFARILSVGAVLGSCAFTTLNARRDGVAPLDAFLAVVGAALAGFERHDVRADAVSSFAPAAADADLDALLPADTYAREARIDAAGLARLLAIMAEDGEPPRSQSVERYVAATLPRTR